MLSLKLSELFRRPTKQFLGDGLGGFVAVKKNEVRLSLKIIINNKQKKLKFSPSRAHNFMVTNV